MAEQNYGIRLTAEAGGFVAPTEKAAESQKKLKEEIQGVAQASRQAGEESVKFVQKLREETDAVSRMKRESEDVAALRKRINDQRELEISRIDASRAAQVALTREVEQGTHAMRAGAAEALALAAGQSTLRGAVTALIGMFMGPAGLVATLGAAALGWVSFGRAAEDAGDKAAAAAKKVADLLPRQRAQLSANELAREIQQYSATRADALAKMGDPTISGDYRGHLQKQADDAASAIQARLASIQQVMAPFPDPGMTLDEARKGLRSPTSARREFDERVRNLYDVYGREISGGGSPEYVASMQSELVEQYAAAKRQYDATLASFAPRGGRGGGGGGFDDGALMILGLKNQLAAASGEASAFDQVMRRLTEGTKEYSHEVRAEALALAGEMDERKAANDAVRAAARAQDEATRAYNLGVEQQWKSVAALEQNNEKLAQHNREIGLGKAGVDAMQASTAELTLTLMENERAMLGYKDGEDPYVQILDARIAAQRRLIELLRQGSVAEASAEGARRAQEEWKRSSTVIEHSLADALMRGFERGESFGENLANALKNMFKTLVLEPIIRPVAQAGAAAVLGAIGMPSYAGGATGGGGFGGGFNLLSNASSIGNLFSGGSMLQTAADFGNFFGSIGSITEAGSTFGLMDAIGGFAASNPWTAVAAIAAPFVLSSLFGGGGGPKPSEAVLDYGGGATPWNIGQNNVPGAEGPLQALEDELTNPALFDQDKLIELMGGGPARRSFWASPGDINSLVSQIRAFAEPARVSAQARNADLLAQLQSSGTLASSLQGWVDAQATSSYLSPEDQLSGARSLFEATLAQAGAGDAAAMRNLPGYADRLLGAGRGVYASSLQFQELRGEVLGDMAQVLKDQGARQQEILADMPVAIREGTSETVKALDKLRLELVKKLEDMALALRQGGLGSASA